MSSSRTTTNSPHLPQETIDQIIDEVAYSAGSNPQQTQDALKACALVSRAFNSRSRNHLFSTVDLIFDRSIQKRAGRLLEILRRKDGRTPVAQHIQRFNLLFEFRNSDIVPIFFIAFGMTKPFVRTRNFFLRALQLIGLREHKLHQVLDIIGNTNLAHFSLGSKRGLVRWSPQRREIDDKLLRIVAQPSLKSLHLHSLMDLPEIYIRTIFQIPSLTDLKISYLFSPRRESSLLPKPDTEPTLAEIKTMELRFMSYNILLAIIRNLHPSYSRVFSHVHTLTVCIPKFGEERDALWDIIQSAAPSLTTLKMESHGQINSPSMGPIKLTPLKSLKHIEFSLTVFREDTDIGLPELYLSSLLSSATARIPLESINITFSVTPGSDGHPDDVFRPSEGWTNLDNALNNRLFPNLKSVNFDVKTARYTYGNRPPGRPLKDVEMKDSSRLLPIMTASPSVDTRLYLSVVKTVPDTPLFINI